MGLQKFSNNASGTTTTALAIGGTTFTLQSGEGGEFPVLPTDSFCYVRLGTDALNEVVKVTARSGDVFTCVATTLAWAAGVPCVLTVSKEMLEGLAQASDMQVVGMALARMRGLTAADSGVFMAHGDKTVDDDLKVVAQSSPNMTVKVKAGACVVLGFVTGTPVDVDVAVTAPPTNNRYTIIQISTVGVITKKDGTEAGSPVVPDPDANNYRLCSILCSVAMTDIENADCTDDRTAI